MGTKKFSDFGAVTSLNAADIIAVVQSGANKKITFANLFSGYLKNLVEDTTPQLGGNLDANGKNIEGVTPTEMGYLSGITSAVQTQLNAKMEDLSDDTSPELGGDLTAGGNAITNVPLKTQTLTDGASVDWNLNNGGAATITFGGDRTINAATNQVAGGWYFLIMKAGASARTLTWNANYLFPSSLSPNSIASGTTNIIMFYSDGTNMYGVTNYAFS